MSDYRLYSIDQRTAAMRAEDFTARSDTDAIRIAVAMKKAVNCELWSLDRLVARIPYYRSGQSSLGAPAPGDPLSRTEARETAGQSRTVSILHAFRT